MAVKWAVADGNWNATTTWNDGTLPQVGDEVYCNGHVVTLNVDVNIGSGTIRNDANADLNIVAGGNLAISNANRNNGIIASNLKCGGFPLVIISANVVNYYIIGDIWGSETAGVVVFSKTYNSSIFLFITGNVNLTNGGLSETPSTRQSVYNINGNLTTSTALNVNNAETGLTINGVIDANTTLIKTAIYNDEVVVSGKMTMRGVALSDVIIPTLTINGSIEYSGATIGVNANTLNILNPDTFTWKDISTTRVNPFIIVTDADMNNRQQYPQENEVKAGTEYVWGQKVGTYAPDYPPEAVVLKGYRYDNDTKEGTLENQNLVGCVTPEDVRKDVPLVGMGVVGSLVVPSVDDVREGVVFDNGSVGTLVVQGGGERLRIADFSYYTNAQSDTYIVDITDADKPKFASAEERVLIEMFPELDLENIPDKYFDDLFVKYLKYRLIVEYYRTAGINSTFTPSEVTTEIVNYQNVRNEVWLNSANTYLKAWGEKYPNSIKKQRIML